MKYRGLSLILIVFLLNDGQFFPWPAYDVHGQLVNYLEQEEQARKVIFDAPRARVYWLNNTGEIYRVQLDGSQLQLVNKGFGTDIGTTLIEDFCLDVEHEYIYFTDLFDIKTGQSAIKRSDLDGNALETIYTFAHETPYHLTIDPTRAVICYASTTKRRQMPAYQLGMIRLDDLDKITVYNSTQKPDLGRLPFIVDESTASPQNLAAVILE